MEAGRRLPIKEVWKLKKWEKGDENNSQEAFTQE